MTTPAVTNLLHCFDTFTELCSSLSDAEWATPSLCPGWSVQDVAAHLAGIEKALLGWPPSVENPPPFDTIGPYMQTARGWSGAQLLDDLRTTLTGRRAELAAMDDAAFDAPSWTPVGNATYGRFMAVRTFDFWVHEQDIRVPVGKPGHLTGGAAEMSLDEVRMSMGYIVGKRAGIPDGNSVKVVITGPISAELCAVVDGRARAVPTLEHPDATVTTDLLTFMLLACGRIDPEGPISSGAVTYAGDAALADQLARNLRFTF
ncbi:MAG: maleylpyruvate isomerase family mycothiol-dependent enzyme [Acidimicrobiales bacterium]|nr:maleylpyruvate isomerase family mycothiol-dependent enzyme [Acidimicrobiales bacterium]